MQAVKPSTSADSPFSRSPDGALDDAGPEELEATKRRKRSKPSWAVALEWAVLIVSALAIALLIKTFLFQAFYIPSDSMVPTLKTNDRVIVNKLSYHLHSVHRGDIVVFTTPPGVDPSIKDLVKRVIGLPGETIEGRKDGHVYINGKELIEGYLPKGTNEGPTFDAIKIPPDSYWVMGDNRDNSKDSRFFPNHFIRKSDIVGRVFVRIWPLNRLAIL
jgi:signal peptidase I